MRLLLTLFFLLAIQTIQTQPYLSTTINSEDLENLPIVRDLNNLANMAVSVRVGFDDQAYMYTQDNTFLRLQGLGGSSTITGINENNMGYGRSTDQNFTTEIVEFVSDANTNILARPEGFPVVITTGNNVDGGTGYHFVGDFRKSFYSDENLFSVLPDLGGESQAWGISNSGDIVGKVENQEGFYHPALWNLESQYVWNLESVDSFEGEDIVDGCANAIAENGDFGGFFATSQGQPKPFVFQKATNQFFELPNYFQGV